ncbi:MAG: hypothetical protein AABX06_02935, partial [Thermoproteota archaeon]
IGINCRFPPAHFTKGFGVTKIWSYCCFTCNHQDIAYCQKRQQKITTCTIFFNQILRSGKVYTNHK